MTKPIAATALALTLAGCLESTLPDLRTGALRPPGDDTAVLLSVGDVALPETVYDIRPPLTPPTLVFDGPEGATLVLRFRDLTRAGTETTDGQAVRFEWTAPGGRVFTPDPLCALTVFDPLGETTPPRIEGLTICEARAPDGTSVTVAVQFRVSES
jgi:hypothetical protein